MILSGKAVKIVEQGVWCFVPMDSNIKTQLTEKYSPEVTVEFDDGRVITSAQRRKIYVLIRHISEWWMDTPQEAMKELLKLRFREVEPSIAHNNFSLSDTDRTTARQFITWLIEFCLIHGVPCKEPLWKLCEDIEKYIYVCFMQKVCACCGKKAELHHVSGSRVGMGRNRKEIPHIGLKALPLCRAHHNEVHMSGEKDFIKKYILVPLEINEEIAEKYKLSRRTYKERVKDCEQ